MTKKSTLFSKILVIGIIILFIGIAGLPSVPSKNDVGATFEEVVVELTYEDDQHIIITGEKTEYNITMKNNGSSTEDFNITTQDIFLPETGVICYFEDEISWFHIRIEPSQSYLCKLFVNTTPNAWLGDYVSSVGAYLLPDQTLLASINTTTTVIARGYGIVMDCPENNKTVRPEQTAQYFINVKNLGNVPDDFLFTIGGSAYLLEGVSTALILPNGTVYPEGWGNPTWHLAANETAMIILNVTIFYTSGTYEINVTGISLNGPDPPPQDTITTLTTINCPPNKPAITGPTNGRKGVWYEYNFSISDPDGDSLWIHIDWEHGTPSKWDGPFPSGSIIKCNYSWRKKGTYTIRAQTMDSNGLLSDWGTLEVTIPRNKATFNSWTHWFLGRFPMVNLLLNLMRWR